MPLFLSTYTNKVDKKGRVSVPASFRTAAANSGFQGIVVHESFKHPCLRGADMDYMERLSDSIDSGFGPYSEEHDAMATAILAAARQLPFDPEGRVMLPPPLMEYAGLSTHATFVGLGKTFQIWEPDAFNQFSAEQRERARDQAERMGPIGDRKSQSGGGV